MRTFTFRGLHVVGAAASLLLLALGACSTPAPPVRKAAQGSFESPEAAIRALGETAGSGSRTEIVRLFGPDGIDLLFSGDEVADREDALAVRAMIAQRVAFEPGENGSQVALLGNDAWPLPVPLVQGPDGWRFDIAAGREELENRRVGRNELVTIEALHAFVDAQREYASEPHDGQPRCYAQHVFSSPDKHDGLYWPTAEGEPDSPLGVLIADATEGGYEQGAEAFHGYIYRILTSRGPRSPSGAKTYVDDKGLMTGGFAMLAWPVKYGYSGVMTFLVDERGIVYQKDLGDATEAAAAAITSFEIDESWEPAADE
jgi:hypothetical protein